MNGIDVNAICRLKAHRHCLTFQQYQTIKGQILAGDSEGAMKGLKKLIEREKSAPSINERTNQK